MDDWVNNREAGDFRCHLAHYDVTVMFQKIKNPEVYTPMLAWCECYQLVIATQLSFHYMSMTIRHPWHRSIDIMTNNHLLGLTHWTPEVTIILKSVMFWLSNLTNPTVHLFRIPQCTIHNRKVHISVLNGALWYMGQVHHVICEFGLFMFWIELLGTSCKIALWCMHRTPMAWGRQAISHYLS